MTLKFQPNKNQLLAIHKWNDNTTSEICYGGAKYGGKSFLGAVCIFHDALVYPETFYFIAREKLNDLRKYTIPTINEVFIKWGLNIGSYASYNGQDNYYQLHNGSRVYFLECSYLPTDPMFERFGSMQMTRGWLEEGGEVHVLAKENLSIACGRKNNDKYGLPKKLLITCNPKKNWLYNQFYRPSVEGTPPDDKAFIRGLPQDNSQGDKDYINSLSELKDPIMRARLYLGDWEYSDEVAQLISFDSITDMFTNNHVPPGEKYITGDIARFGDDKTVLMLWNGFRVERIFSFKKLGLDLAAEEIKELMDEHKIRASRVILDADGVGGGPVDILRCKGFVNNSSPLLVKGRKENYANLKSQCAFRMAERIGTSEVFINCRLEEFKKMIIEECEHLRKKNPDADGKLAITPKDEIKRAIGRSPDYLDCLIMREYFEIAPQYTTPARFRY